LCVLGRVPVNADKKSHLSEADQIGVPGLDEHRGALSRRQFSEGVCYLRDVGRQGRLGGRTTLNLDEVLKRRAMFYALRSRTTLTKVIEAALRLYLTRKRPGQGHRGVQDDSG